MLEPKWIMETVMLENGRSCPILVVAQCGSLVIAPPKSQKWIGLLRESCGIHTGIPTTSQATRRRQRQVPQVFEAVAIRHLAETTSNLWQRWPNSGNMRQ